MLEQKQTLTIQQAIDLAVQHHTAGRLPEAESIYQQILQSDPDQPVALHLLGVIAHQVGETDTAIDLITKALAIKPDYADAHNNLGNVLKELVRMDEALAHYHKAIAIKLDFAEAHNNLGNVLKELVRMDEALSHYHKALAIKPNYADAHYNLGLALQDLGRLDEAVASYHKALAVKPDYTDAHCNLGLALQDLGRLEEAIASYHKALAVKPDFAEAYYNLGTAAQKLGKLDEAVANYNNALAIKPNYADAHNNLGIALQALGKLEEALASYRKALAIKPDYAVAHSNLLFTLLSSMVDLDKIYEEHCGWETSHAMQHQPLQHQCDGDVHKRLRIGFVSADFRTHSVGYFLEAPFSSYDRERMTIYCYSNSHLEDETTARLRPLVKEWRNIVGWADEKVIDAIQADAIDILVDLSGHTRGNRLTVFARKPAPIQATWLGYPGITTGLTAIDYRLSDEVADPLGVADTLCVEQLIRLPNGHHCYHPFEDAPEIGPLPMTSNQVITFGSFNNLAKITPAVVDSWVGILQAVPRSRLLLKNASLDSPGVRERYMSLFAASIEPERIIFKAWLPSRQAHFALYNEVDIALDTFPFNGVTTTCEALWMGVPVITWCGARHSARLGASLLTRVSLEDLVASDINGYVTTAATLAGDPERLEGLRSGLRDRMRASPLCDGVGFAHDLESMFRNAWQNWCQQH